MPPSHHAFAFRFSAYEAAKTEPIERFYDATDDIGLGLVWQRFQDTRAVLGRELTADRYVQSEADVLAAIARVEPMVPIEGDLLMRMLRSAADRRLGLIVFIRAER
jgi:hypothetical protein